MARDTIECHKKLWKNLGERDLNFLIKRHLYERGPFLETLTRYAKLLQKDNQILKTLEVGCGTAIDSYYLVNAIDNCDAHAVDIANEAIEIANMVGRWFDRKIKLFQCDAINMKFPDKFFNIIFSQGFIEHFKDPSSILKESLRILEDTGLLIINVPHRYSLYTIFKKLKMFLGLWQHGWEREYSLRDFRKMNVQYNLDIVEWGGYGSFFMDVLSKWISVGKIFKRPFQIGSPHFSKNIFIIFKKRIGESL